MFKSSHTKNIRLQWTVFFSSLRPRLYQASASTLQKPCDDASDTVFIENNGVTPEWGYNPFSSDSIVFNENIIASVIAELSQRWHKRLV